MFATSSESARVENCVVAGNSYSGSPRDFYVAAGANAAAATNSVKNCLISDGSGVGRDVFRGDPFFKRPSDSAVDGDWRLKRRSPGCKTGLLDATWMPTATDLGGEPRCFLEGKVDIGCYESPWFSGGFLLLVR